MSSALAAPGQAQAAFDRSGSTGSGPRGYFERQVAPVLSRAPYGFLKTDNAGYACPQPVHLKDGSDITPTRLVQRT